MANGFYLITGTSKGIGNALARKLIDEGNTVVGVSRTPSVELGSRRYHHVAADIAELSGLDGIIERANETFRDQDFDFLCLINNASLIEPLGSIEDCSASDIEAHLRIGVTASMTLTSQFMRSFADERIRKKVVFISSGAAFHPMAGASLYCSSKAAITMFAECLGAEQKDREHGFEVHSIGPGMVETPMQQTARSKSSDEFATAEFFKNAFREGRVKTPEEAVEGIYGLLLAEHEQGKYVTA